MKLGLTTVAMSARDWIDPFRLYNPTVPAGRLMYFWGSVVYPTLLLMLVYVIAFLLAPSEYADLLAEILSLGYYPAGLLITIRRFKDRGKSGWSVLALLIPFVGLIVLLELLFAPGVYAPPTLAAVAAPEPVFVSPPPTATRPIADGKCPECHAEVTAGTRSCPWCGTALTSPLG